MIQAFLGTWKLTDYVIYENEGKTSYPYGRNPSGVLMYDPQGSMAVQIMRPGIPPFAVDDRWMGTPEEMKAALHAYIAYYGSFSINETQKTVTHHVEGSIFPNYIGKKLLRIFEFSGNSLLLSTPPMAFGGEMKEARLTWTRSQ